MWERIREIIRKEFIQTLRNPRMRVLLFGPPLIQLLIFGYAVNMDVQNAKVVWIDLDHSPEARDLLAEFQGSSYFNIEQIQPRNDIETLLDRGSTQCVIRVLPGFSRDIKRGNTALVQVLIDGSNSNTAAILSGYINQVVVNYSARVLEDSRNAQIMGRTGGLGGVPAMPSSGIIGQNRVWFNPDLQSRDYFIPGVVVNIIALVTIMLTAMSIVREKEIGTMEQLMVTPIRPFELILGKLLPFAVIGIFEVALITTAAFLVFRVPLRGSLLVLLACSVVFLLTTLGVGLFISTVSHTQQQAMLSSFLFFMPAMMLSGFAFPIRNMPLVVQYLSYLDPLRYFMQIVRGVFLKGTGIQFLWPQIAEMAAVGFVIFSLSVFRFHKRLD
ncbi:MAG: type transporter [Acidobacteria bacterium]|nr:type transporter [Acidobacteriota bacterium]